MRIDAHIHFWRLARGDNDALDPSMTPIWRDRPPSDLRPMLDQAGVVGWWAPASPTTAEELAALAAIPLVKGVRPVRGDNRSIAWMAESAAQAGWRELERSGLALDVLVQDWRELPLATDLTARLGALRIVLDHCAKPDIASGRLERWA